MSVDRAMGPNERADRRRPPRCAARTGARRGLARGSWRALLVLLVSSLLPTTAWAGTMEHVVAKGETLGSLAKRYGTSVRAIEQVNRLRPDRHLYPGQKLLLPSNAVAPAPSARVPPPTPPPSAKPCAGRACAEDEENEPDEGDDPWICSKSAGGRVMALPRPRHGKSRGPTSHERKPPQPGYVSMLRYGERFRGKLVDEAQRVVPAARDRISHLLRDLRANKERPIDERLLKLIAKVSDHFGGRTVVVVSGYREYSPRQHTRSSRHNIGLAIDFRVVGVPVEEVWEYCLELGGVGVGYYPTSSFVHLDVRGFDAAWVDTSRPGERPTYACRPPRGESEALDRQAHAKAPASAPAHRQAERASAAAVPPTGSPPSRTPTRSETGRSSSRGPKAAPARTAEPRGRAAGGQSS